MLKVVVERSKWGSGDRLGKNTSKLYNDESGLLCCLGFACLAAGNTLEDIEDLAYPHDLLKAGNDLQGRPSKPFPLLVAEGGECTCEMQDDNCMECDRIGETNLCGDLVRENDAPETPSAKREAWLIDLGKKAGIEFEFVGEVGHKLKEVE